MVRLAPKFRLLSLLGLVIALGLPALAIVESHVTADLSALNAAIILAATPWLVLGWVVFAERRPLASIGLRRPDWSTLGLGLAGIAVNVAISVGVGAINSASGLREPDSSFMSQLVQRHGVILVFLVTGGAVLTEIAFRGYAIERIAEFAKGRLWVGAVVQIVITTFLFILSRGLAHGC